MATAVTIQEKDMRDFLEAQGFREISLAGTKEIVYGKRVGVDLTLRVYTSVVSGESRGVGEDAIRCVLFHRNSLGIIKCVGSDTRVHRVEGWRSNLQSRIDGWSGMLGPCCDKCGSPTVRRRSKRGFFWGCVGYPDCRSIQNYQAPVKSVPVVAKVSPAPVASQSSLQKFKVLADDFGEWAHEVGLRIPPGVLRSLQGY